MRVPPEEIYVADIDLTLVSAANSGQPAVTISLDLAVGNTPNADGSYTVSAASGTYTAAGQPPLDISLSPGGVDGADNELFLNGGPLFDLGGLTFTTNGDPNAATYVGSSTAYPQDINLFYTGSTTSLGNETFGVDLYGIDTAPVTYLIQPDVNNIVASGTELAPSSVQIANAITGGTIEAEGSTTPGAGVDSTVTVGPTTLTGVLLEATGAGLVDVQAVAHGAGLDSRDRQWRRNPVRNGVFGPRAVRRRGGHADPVAIRRHRSDHRLRRHRYIVLANLDVVSDTVTELGGDTLVSVTGTEGGQIITDNLTFIGALSANEIQLATPTAALISKLTRPASAGAH